MTRFVLISITALLQAQSVFICGDHIEAALDDYTTPCHGYRSNDQNFQALCAMDYSQKPYMCDPDHAISRADIDRIDREVIRPAKLFYYCPRRSAQSKKDRKAILIEDVDQVRDSGNKRTRRRRNGKGAWADDEPRATDGQSTSAGVIGRPGRTIGESKPIVISVNVYKELMWPQTRSLVDQLLPCASSLLPFAPSSSDFNSEPTKDVVDTDNHEITEQQILNVYSTLSEKRWRSSKCRPNLTILVFTDRIVKHDLVSELGTRPESSRRPRIFARLNHIESNPGHQLTEKIQTLIKEINIDNASTTGALKLERFLSKFAQWYAPLEADGDTRDGTDTERMRHHHTIPTWAAITFGVCSVLSVLAILVGNLVTSTKVTRRNKNPNGGRSKRKWGAGFSGGMWASV